MKKLICAVAATALLAACNSEAEEEVVDEPVAEEEVVLIDTNGETMEAYLGDWDTTYPDGSTAVTTNNADGTYSAVLEDGTTMSGTWTFGAEQSCWLADDSSSPTCYTVGAGDENGTRVLTMDDGTTVTVTPVAATEEEAM
tara:strand:- start:15 stop:437 length:423 start_codon:yes stop_codon:yes gene_type:complete